MRFKAKRFKQYEAQLEALAKQGREARQVYQANPVIPRVTKVDNPHLVLAGKSMYKVQLVSMKLHGYGFKAGRPKAVQGTYWK